MQPLAPTEHILHRDGCPIHFWLHGAASLPLLVLTHGAGCDHRMFDPQLPALEGLCRVLTWDVRGHGQSRPRGAVRFTLDAVTDDLVAVLDHLGVSEVIIGGQSMGGLVAQVFAERRPERTRAMVLIDTANIHASLSAIEKLGVQATPALLKLYPYEALLKQSAQAAAITPAAQRYVVEAMRLMPKEDIAQVMAGALGVLRDAPDFRFNRSMFMAMGDHSRAGSIRKQMPAWAQQEPQANFVVVPNAGHCCNLDNPAAFNAALITWLQAALRR